MYLRTLSTQPVDYIENNFTLAELSADIDSTFIPRLSDKHYATGTIIKFSHDTDAVVKFSHDTDTVIDFKDNTDTVY